MKLTKEQVLHIAELARLGLSEKEVAKFQKELSGILEYVGKLNEVNTDGVEPTSQITGLKNVMREDKETGLLAAPDALMACSPLAVQARQIRVKKVL